MPQNNRSAVCDLMRESRRALQTAARRAAGRWRGGQMMDALEPRVLLSAAIGAVEVWAGNDALSGDSLYNIDQSGYTQLGASNARNSSFTVSTSGSHYDYFVLVSRGKVQVDAVQGSDLSYLATTPNIDSASDNAAGMTGAPDGNYTTLGTQVNDNDRFAGYAEFANPGAWTGLTVTTGSMGAMFEGEIGIENDYLPGDTSPYNYRATLRVYDNGLITAGEVRNPAGVWYPLTLNSNPGDNNAEWEFSYQGVSRADVNAAIPNGTYTFVVNSPVGTTTTQFSYTRPSLAPIPTPIGLTDGATGVPTSPTFNWNSLNDANPNDSLELEIDGPNSQDTLIDQPLDSSATSNSPSIALTASSNYEMYLRLDSWSGGPNADGFQFNTGITNETDLLFHTTDTTTSAPGLNFTAVSFPAGTIHPGDWIRLPITGGNSGGNAIGKSGGNVVPIQYEAVLAATKSLGSGNIVLSQNNIGDPGFMGGVNYSGGGDDGPFVQIPASATPGTYYVGLKLDPTGVVAGNSGNTLIWSATKITITANGTIAVTPPGTQAATAGKSQPFALGSFTPSNVTGPYSVDVNWGDGSADSIFTVAGTGSIPTAAHAYAGSGNDMATVTVSGWNGKGAQSATFNVTVAPPVAGALEVWAGNDALSGDSLYNIGQSDYTQLGVSNAQNSTFTISTSGNQYSYFVLVSRGKVQVDAIQGSDGSYLANVDSVGNTSDGGSGMVGASDGNYTTLGTQVNEDGAFAGYVAFANPNSWTSLTVTTGAMGVMLEGEIYVESDYLPGASSPYYYDGELGVRDNGLITSGEVQNPAGAWYPLTLNTDSGNGNPWWEFGRDLNSLADLNAMLPDGTYTFVVNSPVGTTTTQFSYTRTSLTTVPMLSGLANGATNVPTNATFNWYALHDTNPNDSLELEIDGPNTTNTTLADEQLDINSDTSYSPTGLIPSSNYSLLLSVDSYSNQGPNSDGFNFNTDIANETNMVFRTAGTAGGTPALSLTSLGLPTGTVHPGDWIQVPVTGGNTGGNACGTSNGNAIPMQYEVVLAATKTWDPEHSDNIVLAQNVMWDAGILGGDGIAGTIQAQVPASVAPGTYYIGAKIDSGGVVAGNTGNTLAWSASEVTISANGAITVIPPGTQTAKVGQSQSFALGGFTQFNATAPFAVDVNWGDGSADSVFIAGGTGSIPAAAHNYASGGNDTVTVTVSDWYGEAAQSATFTVAAGNVDVSFVGLGKTISYNQTSSGAAALKSTGAFQFGSVVSENAADTVSSATFTAPGGAPLDLTQDFDNQYLFEFHGSYDTQAALDTAYPNGTYHMQVNADDDGTRDLTLSLTGDQYPNAGHFTCFSALQGADPSQPITITWDPMSNGTAGDYVQVDISDTTSSDWPTVFESPGPGVIGALNGTATSATVPAGTLIAGHPYHVWLEMVKVVSTDTTDYPGVANDAFYVAETEMEFTPLAPVGTLTATAPANQTATAGSSKSFTLGSFTQANATGPFSADVHWGDGSADTIIPINSAGTIPATTHTYASGGSETVSVTVSDAVGAMSNVATFGVTVAPVATLAPATLTGNRLVMFTTDATGNGSPPDVGILQFTSITAGNINDLIWGNQDKFTYNYTVTSSTSATFVAHAPDGSHTVSLTFMTASTGTWLSSESDGSQDGTFVLFTPTAQNLAPAKLVSENLTLHITTGGGTYPSSGGLRLQTAASGTAYTVQGISGLTYNSTGTGVYTRVLNSVPGLASVAYTDYQRSPGKMYLAFTSASGGIYYSTDATKSNGLEDFHTGTFTLDSSLPSLLAFVQQPANTGAGQTLAPVIVNLKDALGRLDATNESNVTLTWTAVANGATVSGTTTVAAIDGVATFNNLSQTTAGTYTLAAADGALAGATSKKFSITAATASHMVCMQNVAASYVAGAKMAPSISFELLDPYDNVAVGYKGTVTLAANGPSLLQGTTSAAVKNGVATFSNLKLLTVGTYTLQAAAGSFTANSDGFTVSPGAAKNLAFVQPPTTAAAGMAITPDMTVKVTDAFGNLIANSTASITLAVASGPKGGTFMSATSNAFKSLTVTATGGVATFSGLGLTTAGSYKLKATAAKLTLVTSGSLTISPAIS